MNIAVKQVDYYYTIVDDSHGKGYWLLEHFRQNGVGLVSFTAFPVGKGRSQIDLVPTNVEKLIKASMSAGIELVGPKKAFIVQGDDEVGAIVETHYKLSAAGINVHAANGISDGTGRFGYIFWVKPEDYDQAVLALAR